MHELIRTEEGEVSELDSAPRLPRILGVRLLHRERLRTRKNKDENSR